MQSNMAIHLQIENKAGLSSFLKMRGTHKTELLHINYSIWSYLLSKQIAISGKHLLKSRNAEDNSEWKLGVPIF